MLFFLNLFNVANLRKYFINTNNFSILFLDELLNTDNPANGLDNQIEHGGIIAYQKSFNKYNTYIICTDIIHLSKTMRSKMQKAIYGAHRIVYQSQSQLLQKPINYILVFPY